MIYYVNYLLPVYEKVVLSDPDITLMMNVDDHCLFGIFKTHFYQVLHLIQKPASYLHWKCVTGLCMKYNTGLKWVK